MRQHRWFGLLLLVVLPTCAQFGGLGIPKLKLPSLDDLFKEEPPLTSSFREARPPMPWLDGLQPPAVLDGKALAHSEQGALVLPGVGCWELHLQSYCLRAGTHGPGRGEGYGAAPWQGSKATVLRAILQRAWQHPDLPQSHIQHLLWAILAKNKLSACNREIRQTAEKLLTKDERKQLEGSVWGELGKEALAKMRSKLPPAARAAFDAENELRRMTALPTLPGQAELERVAVLAGEPEADGSPAVPRLRWNLHRNGFLVNYDPSSYQRTTVKVWRPQRTVLRRDAAGRLLALELADGRRAELVYDATPPATVTGWPLLRQHHFSGLRVTFPHPAQPGQTINRTVSRAGWLFSGRPTKVAPGHAAAASPWQFAAWLAPRYVDLGDWAERAEGAAEQYGQVQDWMDRAQRQPDEGAIDDLTDLGHYQDGLDAALGGDLSEKIDWVSEHLSIVTNAWNYCSNRLGGLLDGDDADDQGAEFDPSEDMAMPSHTGRQRLGQSSRSW
ncbi:MAG: hypothetical protein IT204_16205 [Fimbriimonadaceae bacterium]|nr:hypothetical protein [Fimbriimonadaceae bacterium]